MARGFIAPASGKGAKWHARELAIFAPPELEVRRPRDPWLDANSAAGRERAATMSPMILRSLAHVPPLIDAKESRAHAHLTAQGIEPLFPASEAGDEAGDEVRDFASKLNKSFNVSGGKRAS